MLGKSELQIIDKAEKTAYSLINIGVFNIPKKKNEGEDADPISIVDSNSNWGVIGVFDGLGGAGSKKYRLNTGEEHTSAYWGARIVKDCVEKLINSRTEGTNPIVWIDGSLHKEIRKTLNDEIIKFNNVNGPVLSKMTRKLPTTMALSAYEIKDDKVEINTYWAGDSRVYLLMKNSIKILTIDDVNAEDEDPFSPLNIDLAMNNAISQEKDFIINKSVVVQPFSSEEPFMLIAATDGCFGYFKNPIEFEEMLRSCLVKSNDGKTYCENIKKAIIDNIQQDDFSISIVAFGGISFDNYIKQLSYNDNKLVIDYFKWKKRKDGKLKKLEKKISKLEKQLVGKKAQLESFHSAEEQENMEWYAKYKDTFSVVNNEEIKAI